MEPFQVVAILRVGESAHPKISLNLILSSTIKKELLFFNSRHQKEKKQANKK